jgi:hypothetical protein
LKTFSYCYRFIGMHKIIPLLIFLSLSACGGGGSDAVETAVTDAATKQAEEAATAAAAAAAEEAAAAAAAKAAEEQASALAAAAALQDAANQAQQTALQKFGTGKFGQSTFQ